MNLPARATLCRTERSRKVFCAGVLALGACITTGLAAERLVPAFPGAEGFGAITRGSRGSLAPQRAQNLSLAPTGASQS